jgi:hypothetical protein
MDITSLGQAWYYVHSLGMPLVFSYTIIKTGGSVEANICKSQSNDLIKACVPCYRAGTAVLQIVAFCTKKQRTEGKME